MEMEINGRVFKIMPTSCMCGGSFAWFVKRPSGAWESRGCVCHNLPEVSTCA
jgi:hypothetical protein